MKAYIIEDDPITVEVLKRELLKLNFEIVGVSKSIAQSRRDIGILDFQLCLADIQLVDGNVFELFDDLVEIPFAIIFITAFEEYAIRAIKLSALDYILKPIDFQELYKSIEHFRAWYETRYDLKEQVTVAREIYEQKHTIDKIMISNNQRYIVLQLKDIIYISSSGSYSLFLISNDQSYLSSKPLHYYEELLQGAGFIRVHNKYIINMHQVKSIIRKNNNMFVQMQNDETLPVSKLKKRDFLKYFYY